MHLPFSVQWDRGPHLQEGMSVDSGQARYCTVQPCSYFIHVHFCLFIDEPSHIKKNNHQHLVVTSENSL